MTTDFLIGAIRASRDLHPQVKTELEEILWMVDYEKKKNQEKQEKHPEGFYTVDDLMDKFGIERRSAYRLCKEEGFPTVRVGGKYLIPKDGLSNWIENGGSKRGVIHEGQTDSHGLRTGGS